jgi:hypothetical protein
MAVMRRAQFRGQATSATRRLTRPAPQREQKRAEPGGSALT